MGQNRKLTTRMLQETSPESQIVRFNSANTLNWYINIVQPIIIIIGNRPNN